jgi:hypothetical protein
MWGSRDRKRVGRSLPAVGWPDALCCLLALGLAGGTGVQGGTASPAKLALDLQNPHQGLLLWGTDYADGAPANHYGARLFHIYLPWREIETADQVFDWGAFETNHLAGIRIT